MNNAFTLSVILDVCQAHALKENEVNFTGAGNEPFVLGAPIISPKQGRLHLISGGARVRSVPDREFGVDSLPLKMKMEASSPCRRNSSW